MRRAIGSFCLFESGRIDQAVLDMPPAQTDWLPVRLQHVQGKGHTMTRQWTLDAGELTATREKIDKINARAEKRGFTGRLELTWEKKNITETGPSGLKVEKVVFETKLEGEAPKYEGWTFLATLDWDEEAGLIVRTAPGVESVSRDGLVQNFCGHCNTTRYRKNTYLLADDDGETIQVGSTCIKDFLGWEGKPVFISEDEVGEDIDSHLGSGGYSDPRWTVESALAASWAVIKAFGWVPASSYSGTPTRQTVMDVLEPRSKQAREISDEVRPYVADAMGQAKIVREWILSDEFSGHSEYVHNLKAIIAAETVGPKNLGFLASAPQAWAKAQERDLARRQAKQEITNEYFGTVGDRVDIDVKIKSVRFFDGQWGTTALYTLINTEGYVFKWFSSNHALPTEATDEVYKIKGTIKKHEEYQDMKSTVLTRCKVQE